MTSLLRKFSRRKQLLSFCCQQELEKDGAEHDNVSMRLFDFALNATRNVMVATNIPICPHCLVIDVGSGKVFEFVKSTSSRLRDIDDEVCGPFHGDRLVWSFSVEFLNEGIEFGLLLKAIHAGRARSFTFEG